MKKIVSIGCGGAGMFSGIVASQLKKGKFEAIALSDEADIYCRCTTPYVLTGEAKLADAIQPDSMAGDYGVKVVHEKALKINTKKKEVYTDKGNTFEYDYLVIAIGATNNLILSMFMLEAGFIGLIGGVVGIVIGYGVAFLVGIIAEQMNFALLVRLDPFLIIGALAFAMIVGMISGAYPASRAAKLDPVEALRGTEGKS